MRRAAAAGGERTGQLHVAIVGATGVLDDAAEALGTVDFLELPEGVSGQVDALDVLLAMTICGDVDDAWAGERTT